MIRDFDFEGYFELSQHLREKQFATRIKRIDDLYFRELIGQKKYEEFYLSFSKKIKVNSVNVGAITTLVVDSTADIVGFDYLYLSVEGLPQKRFKYEVIDATTIRLIEINFALMSNNYFESDYDSTGLVAGAGYVYDICLFEYFELLRPYFCTAFMIDFAQTGGIIATEAGLTSKKTDFSDMLSEAERGQYIGKLFNDLGRYKNRILSYLNENSTTIATKKRKTFGVAKKATPYNYDQTLKRDIR